MATQYANNTLPELTSVYRQALIDVLDDESVQSIIDECETEFQERGIQHPYLGQAAHAAEENEISALASPIEIDADTKLQTLTLLNRTKSTQQMMNFL
jgi:hypothetical protein